MSLRKKKFSILGTMNGRREKKRMKLMNTVGFSYMRKEITMKDVRHNREKEKGIIGNMF